TTTSNSIVLTPAGNAAPSNVSVTVMANGGNYSTLTSTISYNNGVPANLAITGPTNIPTIDPATNSYSVSNLPAGATVSWSASPSGLVNLTTSGNVANILPNSEASGAVTLTANITVACGTQTTQTFTFYLQNACDLI